MTPEEQERHALIQLLDSHGFQLVNSRIDDLLNQYQFKVNTLTSKPVHDTAELNFNSGRISGVRAILLLFEELKEVANEGKEHDENAPSIEALN